MRIYTPEMQKLDKEIEPYLEKGNYSRLKPNAPEEIRQKQRQRSKIFDDIYNEMVDAMFNTAVQHVVHGKVVYQSDNWDEVHNERIRREKAKANG